MMALLEVYGLNKRFRGLHAVKDVSFTLQTGSITGVLGPNGAGKTTMFNLLTGFVPFDTGTVNFDGQSLARLPPHKIVNRGLARTFQLARPFVGMTVLENVEVACLWPCTHVPARPPLRRDDRPGERGGCLPRTACPG